MKQRFWRRSHQNVLEARGQTQAEAWWRGCEQARAVGMLGALPRVREKR
ncbi:MAG TPA: hypothetical protein VKD72_24400 [Gemmataceae bacterium]|nr:hypothetical protein [Gemmataceae bacterium]